MSDRNVVLVDVNVPFWSLVRLLIKLAFASIPATIIIAIVFTILSALLGGMGLTFISSLLP